MKKTITVCFLFLPASLLVAQGPRGGGPGFHPMGGPGGGPRAVVTGAPYSGTQTITTQESLAGGNSITHKRQTLVYRDSQGRVRNEETITPTASSGKAAYTAVTIVDPVAGYRYTLDSSTMTAYQTPLPHMRTTGTGTTPPARPTPSAATVVTTNLGTSAINGVACTGTQITETIAAGAIGNAQPIQIVRVTWISNDLKVPVEIKSSDPRFGTTDMELTNITTSEPSASLFAVPAGYTVKTGGGRGPGGPRGGGGGPNGRGAAQHANRPA